MILLVRHAPVAVRGVCYGQSDVRTEIDDVAASDAIAAQLRERSAVVDRVLSSPQQRTRGPAAVLSARLGVPHTIDARLCELSFGAWEGRRYADLEGEPAFAAWMRAWETQAPPGGERLADLLDRVRAWWRDASRAGTGVVAVTHAGVIRAVRSFVRDVPYAALVAEEVAPLRVELVAPAKHE